MLYYRRKILLALLQTFGGRLSAIQLQKYLFLITRQQNDKSYHFVPYRYGCFSFQANQDMATLGKYGYISVENNTYILNETSASFIMELDLFDQQYVRNVLRDYGSMTQDELITYTYINYPYYAINSSIASNLLNKEQQEIVNAQRRKIDERMLFTIGYEGVSLEEYINKLIIEDVRILCDVRKNAYSQKYGFSKSQLLNAVSGVGIEYIHIPNLGIDSNKRQTLSSQIDYDILFDEYEKTTLPFQTESLMFLKNLLSEKNRIALTCFEKNPNQCHRTRVANALMRMSNSEYSLKHIQF